MKYQVHDPYLTLFIDRPLSIDELFQQFHLSKKTIHLLKQNKDYQVRHHYVPSSTLLKKGDRITIKAFQSDDHMYPPIFEPLDVIYEDEFLLIVNKPPFLNVFPSHRSDIRTLAHLVSGYYHQQGYSLPVRFIHRLDYETSGLVIFVKCAFVQPLLDYQLSIKDIHRDYLAIVSGTLPHHQWRTIRQPIAHDRHHNQRMIIHQNGKSACTHYRCLAANSSLSLLKCSLESGRKHQIRVHLSSIHHPIIGDKLYQGDLSQINHQALHAWRLRFIHPITKEKMTVTCQPPSDMQKIIQKIDPHQTF